MVTLVKQDYFENKRKYNEIKKVITKKLGDSVPINHVGSTAIPNMYGKNIIDILIGASDQKKIKEISAVLNKIGFIPSNKSSDNRYQFFASTSAETVSGDIHIHLVIIDTERYNNFIILKNYLLKNKFEKLNYSRFKRDLIKKGVVERKDYKRIKGEYVNELLKKAKKCNN